MLASGLQPVTYGYDANSRLTGLAQGPQSAALAYDAANRRTTLTLPNGIVLSYSYDAASRLIGQTYTGGSGALGILTYSYDATGNRLTTGGSFARSGLPTSIPTTMYDAANRQLTFGSAAQTFDANGNLLTQTDATGTTTYTWDARNRLTALTGPTVSATFAYDALGRRTTKTINGQSTSVLYDGLDTAKESGPGGDASYLRTLGIDEALSRTDATGTLTYLTDALGSTLALADSSGPLPRPIPTPRLEKRPSPVSRPPAPSNSRGERTTGRACTTTGRGTMIRCDDGSPQSSDLKCFHHRWFQRTEISSRQCPHLVSPGKR